MMDGSVIALALVAAFLLIMGGIGPFVLFVSGVLAAVYVSERLRA